MAACGDLALAPGVLGVPRTPTRTRTPIFPLFPLMLSHSFHSFLLHFVTLFPKEKARESGKEVSDEDKVAAAWAKAKEDAEAAKREKYARARGNRTSSGGLCLLYEAVPGGLVAGATVQC